PAAPHTGTNRTEPHARARQNRNGATMSAHAHHDDRSFIQKYVFSTDHKVIGIQFLFMSLFFLIVGGLLAMVMRWQLAWPDGSQPLPGGSLLPETMVNGGVI